MTMTRSAHDSSFHSAQPSDRMTNLLKMMADCNQLLMRAEIEENLLREISHCILEYSDFSFIWMGFLDHSTSQTILWEIRQGRKLDNDLPVLEAGPRFLVHHIDSVKKSWEEGNPYIEKDIPSGKRTRELWRESRLLSYQSMMALPMRVDDGDYGILALFSPRSDDFEPEIIKIFTDLAADLSVGIAALRTKEKLKKTQEKLIESQNMLQMVMDTIPVRLFWKDKDFIYLGCNKAFALDAGLKSPEEIVGKNDFELSWKETAPLYRADDREIIEKKISKINYEEPQVRENGTSSWLRTTKIPLLNKDGEILGLFGSYEDITEWKKAEEALWESERRYKMATTAGNVGVWDLNLISREMYIDPILKAILGYDDNELENRLDEWTKRIHPDDLPMVRSETEAYLQGTTSHSELSFRMIHRDGSIRWFVARGTVLYDVAGKPYRMVGTHTDITQQKQMELEREKMHAQLLQAQKMEAVGALAGGIAHDFNNLLTTIKGYTDLSLMEITEKQPIHQNLKQIQKAVSRASTLTNQLLLFGRRQLMEPATININETIGNMLILLERVIGEDIRIETDFNPKIWKIWADEGNLEQVIMNLAVNSRDAMPQGGKIFIRTENTILDESMSSMNPKSRPGQFVRITFTDTGTGMSDETMSHLFEPFFTTKEVGKGTGLGLSVIYGIISQHQGWIIVNSTPGEGTTFEIYIPASFTRSATAAEEKMNQDHYAGKGEILLIVEDEEGIREFICSLLIEKGYRVLCASSAGDAHRKFEKTAEKIDLIISDVVLPDQSGLQLVESLRRSHPDLDVILTSGYTGDKTSWDKIQKKGYRFLKKPFAIHELLYAIHTLLENRKK